MAFTTSKRSRAIPVPLCPYQLRWVMDKSRFKIAVKARRVGFTFATTLEIALDVISRRTRWLVISRTQDTAREALREIGSHLAAMQIALTGISERPTGLFFDGMRVHQLVITLPNGSEVIAMTAHPDAARGFGGNVFLDEHGFHRDSEELWKGAAASVMRGHRLIVVSTPHYQTGNFYRLAREAGLTEGPPQMTPTVAIQRRNQAKKTRAMKASDSHSLAGSSASPASSASSASADEAHSRPAPLWSAHWIDIYTAAPQLHELGAPGFENVENAIRELRQFAGDEETWSQEFCCQFLSAAEMWIPLELIAAARSPRATAIWDPESPAASSTGDLYVGADIGRKRDRTAIWIDEVLPAPADSRGADDRSAASLAVCRGVITLDRAPFEQQFELLSSILAHPRVRRACIDQTGIGMALVERLKDRFGSKVEEITFTSSLKEQMSLRVRRRMEAGLDKIPENCPDIERDFAAVKREITPSGNLRFDAARTDSGHADLYWAKALADLAADSGVAAVCLASGEAEPPSLKSGWFRGRESPDPDSRSIWEREAMGMEVFG